MTLSKEVPALSKLQTRFSLESPYHYIHIICTILFKLTQYYWFCLNCLTTFLNEGQMYELFHSHYSIVCFLLIKCIEKKDAGLSNN